MKRTEAVRKSRDDSYDFLSAPWRRLPRSQDESEKLKAEGGLEIAVEHEPSRGSVKIIGLVEASLDVSMEKHQA